jgi:glycosyltransferase involved in cell wall biosynthesis
MNSKFRSEVVIVHRHLAPYRVPLFEALRTLLRADGINLRLIHGVPRAADATKYDDGRLDWAERLPTRYLLGGRVCWQPFGALIPNADLVIVTQENWLLYNLWALTLGRPRRIAFWGHGANLQAANPDGWSARFKRALVNRVDWWFAYTQLSVDIVCREGFPQDRVTNLENAIDTRELAAQWSTVTSADLEAARVRLGLQGARVGLYLGSLYEAKRIPFLLETGAQLAQRVPSFRLLISGGGPQRQLVEQAVQSRPWLRYIGFQQGRDKAIALRLADVMLNPGMVGLGILDAFTAGLPLITTDCGIHSPEIAYLRSGENGLMTANSPEAFVQGVVAMLENEAERRRLGVNAQSASSRYTIENMAQRYRTGINKALQLGG